jgi:hypothetical protein
MADVNELIFIGAFVVYLGIFFTQLYNVLRMGEFHNLAISVVKLILGLVTFGVLFVTSLLNYDILLMTQLFVLCTWLLAFMWVMFLIEIFFFMRGKAIEKPFNVKNNYKAYYPKNDKKEPLLNQ